MKRRFLIQSVLFCLPLALAGLTIEILLRQVPTSYTYKRDQLAILAPKIETLVLGTSNAFYDFDPAQFSRPGFNLANTSQSLTIDRQLVEKYLPQLTNLKLIVLNLSYFSYEYHLWSEIDDNREFFYISDYGIKGDGGWWPFFDLRLPSLTARFGIDVTRRIVASGFKESLAQEVSPLGWFDDSKSNHYHLPVTDLAGKGRADYHTSTMDPKLTRENLQNIEAVVKLARAKGVQVVLSQAPACETYTRHLNPDAEARFRQNTESLTSQLGLRFFGYLRDPRFRSEDYFDNDHLGADAARRFSRIFDEEVLRHLIPDPSIQN